MLPSTALTVVACLTVALLLAGCTTRARAPVVERQAGPARASPPPAATPIPAVSAAPAASADTYLVKRGDTLYSIALEHGMDWRELASLNQLSDPTRLPAGQVLRLRPQPAVAPPAGETSGVVVKPIAAAPAIETRPLGADGAPGAPPPASVGTAAPPAPAATLKTEPKGMRLPYSEQNLAVLQRGDAVAAPPSAIKSETAVLPPPKLPEPTPKFETPPTVAKPDISPGMRGEPGAGSNSVEWAWPATGKVLATFDGGASKGLDIAGRVGDPVYASASGRVVYSGDGIPAFGKLVIIRHNSVYLSAYAHNSSILVREGQSVTKGQKIAELGSTGASQAKLHFEIRREGKPVDPMQYLPNRTN